MEMYPLIIKVNQSLLRDRTNTEVFGKCSNKSEKLWGIENLRKTSENCKNIFGNDREFWKSWYFCDCGINRKHHLTKFSKN